MLLVLFVALRVTHTTGTTQGGALDRSCRNYVLTTERVALPDRTVLLKYIAVLEWGALAVMGDENVFSTVEIPADTFHIYGGVE